MRRPEGLTFVEAFLYYGWTTTDTGCWNYNGYISKPGYGIVSERRKLRPAHRISYEYFKGPLNNLMACHTCDNRSCVNPDHLFAGTQADNMRDMKEKGRANKPVGINNGRSKLSEQQVAEIKQKIAAKEPHRKIANEYGVSPTLIMHIKHGRLWNGTADA